MRCQRGLCLRSVQQMRVPSKLFFFKKQLDKFYYACKITERKDQPSFWWVESIVPTVFDCAPSTIAEISLADRSTDVSTSHCSSITP